MRRFISIATAMVLALGMCLGFADYKYAEAADNSKVSSITAREMPFYYGAVDDKRMKNVYFMGKSDVPYLSLKDCGEIYTDLMRNYIQKGHNISFDLTCSVEGNVGKLTRTDGYPYTMEVDCAADKITFFDYDAFIRPDEGRVLIDVLSVDNPKSDSDVVLFSRTPASYERYGDRLILDLAAYGIDLVSDGTDCYIPAQTFSDFLLAMKYVNILYNGEGMFFVPYKGLKDDEEKGYSDLGKLFYSVEPRALSKEMGAFSYAELCLAFDNLYGLKEVHGIQSLDALCYQTGERDVMRGTDPNLADEALYTTILKHLDDLHSNFGDGSPFSERNIQKKLIKQEGIGQSYLSMLRQHNRYGTVRKKYYPNGVPVYEEFGNTAYITFDHFASIPSGVDYYKTPPTAKVQDTIGIMLYAYSQIMRENSPIENVVLDLSNNLGGDVDTAIFTISAFLGEASISVKNTMSGALSTGVYHVDMNLDHKYDKLDRGLLQKKRFCLISPVSFSCGNLVPNVYKNSNEVVLLGRTSGGGSCAVLPMSTAYGTSFQLSSPMRLSFIKNGSFYDIDRGADPDCSILFRASFYNRQALTEYINGIK